MEHQIEAAVRAVDGHAALPRPTEVKHLPSSPDLYADPTSSTVRWKLERGAPAASENARLTQRAYSLGEIDRQAPLLARRQYLEAALGARGSASRQLRLLVHGHQIWDLALK